MAIIRQFFEPNEMNIAARMALFRNENLFTFGMDRNGKRRFFVGTDKEHERLISNY